MHTVFFDSAIDDEKRRQLLYTGQFFVFSPRPSTMTLCKFGRELIEEAFAPLDPRKAQFSLRPVEFASIWSRLKPALMDHPKLRQCVPQILEELGCDLSKTYFNRPVLRVCTSDGYFSSLGIASDLPPHRDTWYAGPFSLLNWWIPIYDIESESSVAFHLRYWNQAVRNGSSDFDFDEWTSAETRQMIEEQLQAGTRRQPLTEEPIEIDPQLRIVCEAGGVVLFSGAHLHSTVPNTSGSTRFSFDFRTVHSDDLWARKGPPNVDTACTGTLLRRFWSGRDFSCLPDDLVALYDVKRLTQIS